MSSSYEKSIRVISWSSGNEKDWKMFATKQLAKAQLNGYKKHLLGKATIPPHDKVLDATKDAEEIKNRDLNDMAYANLLLSMEDDTAWNLVNNAKSTELPDGDAALAWTKLNDLYEPKTVLLEFDLSEMFGKCKLKSNSSKPDNWFTYLDSLVVRNNALADAELITDKRYIGHLLKTLPSDYDDLLITLRREVRTNYKNVTVAWMKEEIRSHHKQKHPNGGDSDKYTDSDLSGGGGSNSETMLAAKGGPFRRFKGTCNGCGKQGHKKKDCWQEPGNSPPNGRNNQGGGGGGQRFQGDCNYCGKKGHKAAQCRQQRTQYANNHTASAFRGGKSQGGPGKGHQV